MASLRTADKKRRFIQAIERGVSVTSAAEYAEVDRTLPYKWSQNDPVFAKAWNQARARLLPQLKDTTFDRALEGNVELTKFLIARYEVAPAKEQPQPAAVHFNIIPPLTDGAKGASSHDEPTDFITVEPSR